MSDRHEEERPAGAEEQRLAAALEEERFAAARAEMVAHIASTERIHDRRVLAAFARVPRHLFVPSPVRDLAYDDRALPIGAGQTISQPTMIAIMLDELGCEPEHRVLEVGAGSGYAAALVGRLAREVDAVELVPELAERARHALAAIGAENVRVHARDGSRGLPERAPFDRILVSAGARNVPDALVAQLASRGRIVIPVGYESQLLRMGDKRDDEGMAWRSSVPCVFVPLLGS